MSKCGLFNFYWDNSLGCSNYGTQHVAGMMNQKAEIGIVFVLLLFVNVLCV